MPAATTPISAVRVNAPKAANATVIFLHGLGDSGEGWSFLPAEVYQRPSLQHVNFVLPNAPVRDISVFGQRAPGWYDIKGFDGKPEQDKEGILQSLAVVKDLIDNEISRGIPADRIVLGGFSQGCALVEGTAVTLNKKLAGFVAVSGSIPIVKVLEGMKSSVNADTPMLMLHGVADQIAPISTGVTSRQILESAKFGLNNVEWHEYPGLAHSVSPKGLLEIIKFLERVLPPLQK